MNLHAMDKVNKPVKNQRGKTGSASDWQVSYHSNYPLSVYKQAPHGQKPDSATEFWLVGKKEGYK